MHLNIDSNLSPTTLNHIGLGLLPVPQSELLARDSTRDGPSRTAASLVLRGLQFDLFPTVLFNTEGYTRFGDDIASDNFFHTFTALDTLTMIRGNHTLKFGGEVQQHRDNYRNYGNGGGTFNFTRHDHGLAWQQQYRRCLRQLPAGET